MELARRHIQNMSEATTPHWGYAPQVVPCTSDAGTCRYLDVVYRAHDTGMIYTGIFWATILGILFCWAMYNFLVSKARKNVSSLSDGEEAGSALGTSQRLRAAISAWSSRYLLPEFARPIFGRTTRLQVLILATLTGYLTIFSFAGIVYGHWVTPVKKYPGVFNTRTSLGPWSDRVGVLAYALTPLSVLLSSRESVLSLITGLPYQSFNFLHRWLGYIIVVQSILHTIGWCVVEMRLYQPQPSVGLTWIQQLYMIWGVIAMFFLFALFILSTPWAIRRVGYEFFRKSHYVLAMLYIGACIGHWKPLSALMIPALVVWFIDRGARLVRAGLLHYNFIDGKPSMQFRSADASITHFPDAINGDIVRLDFQHPQEPWRLGQHFYLCFPSLSIWQSHPLTPLAVPITKAGRVQHSYIFRAKGGMTRRVADVAARATAEAAPENSKPFSQVKPTIPVILNGPYGVSEVDSLTPSTNILCVAGGTGITYVLPVLLSQISNCACSSARKIQLVWAIRQEADMAWIRPELGVLYRATTAMDFTISIFVTREAPRIGDESNASEKSGAKMAEELAISSSGSSEVAGGFICSKYDKEIEICSPPNARRASLTVERRGSLTNAPPEMRHPDLAQLVHKFVDSTVQGSTSVHASGPGGMISDLRSIVASCNDGGKVWRGHLRSRVELKCDDRLEW